MFVHYCLSAGGSLVATRSSKNPEKKSSSSSNGGSQGSGPYRSLQVPNSTFVGTFGGGNGGLASLPFAAKRGVEPLSL